MGLFGGIAQKGHRKAAFGKHWGQEQKSHRSTYNREVGTGLDKDLEWEADSNFLST